ncbi:MAG: hypothetical protein E6Q88_12075 [Lysobacteraceae bacterium]|nr:MAG: hypothetical protein E6Q88_12075 [Xanthomonadaceae bacterium]
MTAADTPMTAEDIGRRVIKLIDSLHSAKDLAPDHIERQTGIKVEFNESDRTKYGFGGPVTDEWFYNLVSLPEKPGQTPTSLLFSFDDQTHNNADTAPICSFDFADYSSALKAAGFDFKPMHGSRGVDAWYFSRGDIGVLAYTHGNQDPEEGQACVSKLIISAYA